MQSVKSLAKAVSKEMADSLKGTEELLTLTLTKAQKDNNTVYLERVPVFAGRWGPDPIDRIGLHCRMHPMVLSSQARAQCLYCSQRDW
jgi:hypothetical protein